MARYYSAIIVSVDGRRLPAEMMETDQSKRTNPVDRSCSSAALADLRGGPSGARRCDGASSMARLRRGHPALIASLSGLPWLAA
jgi:hypothetical protein